MFTVLSARARLHKAAIDGLVIGIKYGVALAIVGGLLLAIAGDYTKTRQATVFLAEPVAGVSSPEGKSLTRAELVDAVIRDFVQRQQGRTPAPGN